MVFFLGLFSMLEIKQTVKQGVVAWVLPIIVATTRDWRTFSVYGFTSSWYQNLSALSTKTSLDRCMILTYTQYMHLQIFTDTDIEMCIYRYTWVSNHWWYPKKRNPVWSKPPFWPFSLIGGAESLTIMIIKAFNSHLLRKVSSSLSFYLVFSCFPSFWELTQLPESVDKKSGWIWCLGRNFSSWSSPFTAHGSLGVRKSKKQERWTGRWRLGRVVVKVGFFFGGLGFHVFFFCFFSGSRFKAVERCPIWWSIELQTEVECIRVDDTEKAWW